MVTKWKKWGSLLALVLGVDLLLAGIAGALVAVLWLTPLGYGPADMLQQDYRNTAAFRQVLQETFNRILGYAQEDPSGAHWQGLYQDDPNFLYRVESFDWVETPNNPAIRQFTTVGNTNLDLWEEPSAGYGFQLRFQGGKAEARLNGETINLYGDGLYTPDSLWDLPGYQNRPASEEAAAITIYLAVADQPISIYGFSPIYQLYQTLNLFRWGYAAELAVLAAGLLCLIWAFLWRKARREARAALARRTGRIWFEGKLLALVGTPFLAYALATDLRYRLFNSSFWSISTVAAGALLCLAYPWFFYLALNDLRHNEKPWRNSLCVKLWGYLGTVFHWAGSPAIAKFTGRVWFELKLLTLAAFPLDVFYVCRERLYDSSGFLLTGVILTGTGLLYFWLLYLALNDLRHNKKPWQNSLCRMFFGAVRGFLAQLRSAIGAAEMKLPLQRRFFWRGVVAAASVVALTLMAAGFILRLIRYYPSSIGSGLVCILFVLVLFTLLLAPGVWYFYKSWTLIRQLASLTGQLAQIRAGALASPLSLPQNSDLCQAAEDLNGIQQGMRSALEERMKSERMKVELISNVSHDLKTPLTSVISYAELLSEEEDLPRHVQDYIRILNAKAQRLQVMVQDVFEVSKAASGELSLRATRLDLSKLLRQTLADMDETIQQSTLAFRSTLPADPVWIVADGDRLYRVFQNLIQNALQYALDGSRVYVTLAVREGTALASVKNTSRDELPPNTDFTARFVRGDASRSDSGSGLGLAIASSFSAACGGSLQVETDADLFTAKVSFPVAGPGN